MKLTDREFRGLIVVSLIAQALGALIFFPEIVSMVLGMSLLGFSWLTVLYVYSRISSYVLERI